MKIQKTNNQFGVRTNLRAGAQFRELGEFVSIFMKNSLTPSNYVSLQAGLEKTTEQCKQAGSGGICDNWASIFGLNFGHG